MMCRLDIPPLPLIYIFRLCLFATLYFASNFFSLSSFLQVENIKPFSYFPFVFSSIVPIFTRSPPSMRNCPFPNDILCYTHHVARSASIVSFFFNYKAISSQYTSTCPLLNFGFHVHYFFVLLYLTSKLCILK